MSSPTLVLFDADGIKDYVFATGRLKDIRGASEIVRQLTNTGAVQELYHSLFGRKLLDWQEDIAGDDDALIYANGGAGALRFNNAARAQTFCFQLEQHYRRGTGSAMLSAAATPIESNTRAEEAKARERGMQLLAQRKQSRPIAEALPGGGVLRFCTTDRLHPASTRAPDPGLDTPIGILVSEPSARKQHASYRFRKGQESQNYWQQFLLEVPEADRTRWSNALSDTHDLGHISSQARPRGYVALVYADGDSVGRKIGEAVQKYGLKGYQQFSSILSDAAHQATAQALAVAYRHSPVSQIADIELREEAMIRGPDTQSADEEPKERFFLPFEVITVGGDDIILICTGERGLAVACELSRRMGVLVDKSLKAAGIAIDEPFSMSVGVVIAHDSLPIVQLERRGRDLLHSAKQVSKPGLGGIDFHIVTTPGLDTIKRVRQRDYKSEKLVLTKRPYALPQAEKLLRYARYLRGLCDFDGLPAHEIADPDELVTLPESKIADLYHACHKDRVHTTLDVLSISMRLRERERAALLYVLRELESIAFYPFDAPEAKTGDYRTALPDLLEAAVFVAEEGQWKL